MKKYIICILLIALSFLLGCSKQPKCDSNESIQLAKDLIKQELASNKNSNAFAFLGIADKNTLENFVNDNIEVINIRTTSKDNELKKCDCASQITFKFSDELMTKLNEASKDGFIGLMIGNPLDKQIEYTFNLQLIEKDNELFIEGFVPTEDLQDIFTLYCMVTPSIVEQKDFESQNQKNNIQTKTKKEVEPQSDDMPGQYR